MQLDELKAHVGKNKDSFTGSGSKKNIIPMYLPMTQTGDMTIGGKNVPVHVAKVMTRGEFVSDAVSDHGKAGSGLGSAYYGYFYAIVCFILTVFAMSINLYVAAVFAYATGHFWSSRVISPAWNITWYKGKALYHTK